MNLKIIFLGHLMSCDMGFIRVRIFDKDCALVICLSFMIISAIANTVQCVLRRRNVPPPDHLPMREVSRPYNAGSGALPILPASDDETTSQDTWNQQWNQTGNCEFKTFKP